MFLRALRSSVARRPKRFAIAVAAVTVGVAMAVALASVSLALGDRLALAAREYGANLMILPAGAEAPLEVAGIDLSAMLETGTLPESTLAAVRQFRWRNNVLGFAPQTLATATIGGELRAPVVGTWFARDFAARPAGMSTIAPWWKVEGRVPDESPNAAPEVLVGRALATRSGATPGSMLEVAIDDPAGGTDALAPRVVAMRVSGVLDAGGFEDDKLYLPREALAAAIPGARAGFDRVMLSVLVTPGETPPMPDPAKDLEEFERWACRPYAGTVAFELGQALPGASVRPVEDLVRGEARVVGRLNMLMALLAIAALAAAALGVMSTMVASVVDRTQEIALLRAIGATRAGVGGLFLAEMLLVAAVGGVLGAILGLALAEWIGRGAFGTAVPPQPLLVPAGLLLAVLVCVLGAWLPLRRIASVDPARVLRPGA